MFQSQKNVFWEALLVTVFIFGIGILAGILIENMRSGQVNSLYQFSEVELLDIRLQTDLYQGSFNCQTAINETFQLADRVYEEAKILEKYEDAKKLTDTIAIQHKKYDILRAMLFLNSLEIKQKCKPSYHSIVYFYSYGTNRLDIRAKQDVFSNLLGEIKQEKGSQVLLIPIAADNEVASINLLLSNYNISISELPIVLIDEKTKVANIENKADIEQFLT